MLRAYSVSPPGVHNSTATIKEEELEPTLVSAATLNQTYFSADDASPHSSSSSISTTPLRDVDLRAETSDCGAESPSVAVMAGVRDFAHAAETHSTAVLQRAPLRLNSLPALLPSYMDALGVDQSDTARALAPARSMPPLRTPNSTEAFPAGVTHPGTHLRHSQGRTTPHNLTEHLAPPFLLSKDADKALGLTHGIEISSGREREESSAAATSYTR